MFNRPHQTYCLTIPAVLVLMASTLLAAPTNKFAAFPTLTLAATMHGEAAIQSLADKLPEVAAFYDKTPEELRGLLRRDKDLNVDRAGRLFYTCQFNLPPAPAPGGTNSVGNSPVGQIAPLSQTFLLHSRPGAHHLIYLDFDGYTISGTAWNAANNGGADIVAPAWDTDGNPASFSSGEQTAIQQIWLRVAEDYAPFDVDVTTEYPGEAALTRSSSGDDFYGTRALISPIGYYFGNPGGIAYVGIYNDSFGNGSNPDYYKPALIFPENLGPNGEKYIAEAISHEVGHNFGLSHDGTTTGAAYYTGQGNWAPIMGVGYYEPIVQWSKGEYANANNTEDDLFVITSHGVSYRTDDFGNTIGTATLLSGTSIVTNGIIERTNDVDFFSFQTGAGTVQITATPWERGPNLHILLSVYNSVGSLMTNLDAADTSAGVQPVSVSLLLNTGTYYVSVEGIGSGDPVTTGYSDYDSLGNYSLAITLPGSGAWLPVPGGSYSWTNSANWFSGVIPDSPDITANINNNITGDQSITLNAPIIIGRLALGDTNASHGFTIQNGGGGSLTFDVVSGNATITKTAGTNDVITATLTLLDDLIVSNATPARITLDGFINGARGLAKSGAGLVGLAGTNAYAGNTTIVGGTLAFSSTFLFSSNAVIDVRSNAVLDVTALSGGLALTTNQTIGGAGVILGDVTLNPAGGVSPGLTNVAATLTFSNNLTFNGGAQWSVDLAPTNTPGGGTNDLIVVAGNLSLIGSNNIYVSALGTNIVSPAVYTILNYTTLTGGATNLTVSGNTRYSFTADDTVSGQINLNVSGGPTNLTWHGDGLQNRWDIGGASNWFSGPVTNKFFQLDSVTFDDTGSNNTPVNLVGELAPNAVTVNSTKNFTFGGNGWLTGPAPLAKLGGGTLTLSNANDFTGTTTISLGMLKVANSNALGSSSGGTFIQGGTLDLNGINLGAEPVTLSSGVISNNGPQQITALRFVTLTGDATFGGSNRWDIRANPTASLTGGGFKLSKTGTNEIWFTGLGDIGLGDIDLKQGLLGIQSGTTLGVAASNLTMWAGTTLVFFDETNTLNKVLRMTNATVRNDSGASAFSGAITSNNTNLFNIPAATLDLRGSISGPGGISKSSAGTLTLSGSNNFTGTLWVDTGSTTASDGIVKLANSKALTSAGLIIIRNSSVSVSTLQLDGSSGNLTNGSPITLSGRNSVSPAFQNLAGSNTLSGNLTLLSGGTNYWFQSDSGTLNLSGLLPVATPAGLHVLTFSGGGNILISGVVTNGSSGSTVNLIKSGAGALTLNNPSFHSGTNFLVQGVLQANTNNALGFGLIYSDPGANTARLVLGNNVTLTNRLIANTVNPGATFGLLMVNDNTTGTFSGPITFSANATTGGHIAGPVTSGLLSFTGPLNATNAGTFITVRSGNVRFSGGGNYLELQISTNTVSLGATNGISTNAVVDLGGNASTTLATVLDLNGCNQTLAGLRDTATAANAAWVTNSGATTNTLTLNLGNTNFAFGGCILGRLALTLNSGSQTLTKSAGLTALTGIYTYLGNTTINGGILTLAAGIRLTNTPVITVGAGATFDVSASGFALGAAQTLNGKGTVSGNFTNNGTLSPGTNSLGTLTFSNNLALASGSTAIMELTHTGLTNDMFNVTNLLTRGGALVITNIGVAALTAGDTFRLFSAGSYAGSFSSVTLPSLNAGLTWNTNNLPTGTLTVVVSDFGISGAPLTNATQVGGNVAYTVTVTATNGYSSNVVFSVTGLPVGAGAAFSPASVNGAGAATLTLTASNNLATGKYPFTLTGTGGSLVHSAALMLTVTNFISAIPTNISTAFSNNVLVLSWPLDHTGWRLQAQTNPLTIGLGTNWIDMTNAVTTNRLFIPVNRSNGGVFFRLLYP